MKMDVTDKQQSFIDTISADLDRRFAQKSKRLEHIYSVAKEAARLASLYGADEYRAYVAGLLHDWDKIYSNDEIVHIAQDLGLDFGCDLHLVAPILHGYTAAMTLPNKYPELDEQILNAIKHHTTGAYTMSVLEKVVFIADTTDPCRKGVASIDALREKVGSLTLDELYLQTFVMNAQYVLTTHRYLWLGTIDIYNHMVLNA